MADKQTMEALEAKNNTPVEEKKPFNKFGKQEKHTVEGIEYTFQFPGTRRVRQILDRSQGPSGVHMDEQYHTFLMQDVIVSPKVDWDYWDENLGYSEVMRKADVFLGKLLK